MSKITNYKNTFDSSCSTNSEPFILQNLGDMMSPIFSKNSILVIDPSIQIHDKAYAVIDYQEQLYFRQFIITKSGKKIMRCLNNSYADITITANYSIRGCVIQQKQRKQTIIHYYKFDTVKKQSIFVAKGFSL